MKKVIDSVLLPFLSVGLACFFAKFLPLKPLWMMALFCVSMVLVAYFLVTKAQQHKAVSVLVLPHIVANAYLAIEIGFQWFGSLEIFPLVLEIFVASVLTSLYYRYALKIKVAASLTYAVFAVFYVVAVFYAKTEKTVLMVYGMIFLYGLFAIVHGNNALKQTKDDSNGKLLHFFGSLVILSIPLLNTMILPSKNLSAVLTNIPVYYSVYLLWVYFGMQLKSKYLIYPALVFLCVPLFKINPSYGILLFVALASGLEVFWGQITLKLFND